MYKNLVQFAATPSGRDAHVDVPLSNMAVMAFERTGNYIASQVMPVVPVQKESDKYYTIDKDSWLRQFTTKRARKASSKRIEFQVSSDGYFCENYTLAGENALEDLANADAAVMLRQNTVNIVTDGLLRDYEIRVANLMSSATNLGSAATLSGATAWSDYVNSNPLSDVDTAHAFIRQNTGLTPNVAVIDADTLAVLRRHPQILDLFKYTSGGEASMAAIQDVLKVDRVLIGGGIKNNALENATASITNIWGNSVIFARVQAGMSLQNQTYGMSLRWSPAGLPGPMTVTRYNDPDPSKKVEVVEAGYYQDEKVVGQALSYGILTTI